MSSNDYDNDNQTLLLYNPIHSRLKENAVRQAVTEQYKTLRKKAAAECENRIEDAIQASREECEEILSQRIKSCKEESKKIYEQQRAKQEKMHLVQIQKMHQR